MLDQEEIDNQQKLLETHRRTLSHYIRQQAALGFLAPPGVINGIHEAREEIRSIKARKPMPAVEPLTLGKTILTGLSLTILRLSNSNRTTPISTPTVESLMASKGTTTVPSLTSPRLSNFSPTKPKHTTTVDLPMYRRETNRRLLSTSAKSLNYPQILTYASKPRTNSTY
jgi:hypothetical protein